MSKYVISIEFLVEAEGIQKAIQFSEDIQNLIAGQLESKELFIALEGSNTLDVSELYKDDDTVYENLDQNN